jgi:hypothetical protein
MKQYLNRETVLSKYYLTIIALSCCTNAAFTQVQILQEGFVPEIESSTKNL